MRAAPPPPSYVRLVLRHCATCEAALEAGPGLRLCRGCLHIAAVIDAALARGELAAARSRLLALLKKGPHGSGA